MAEKNKRERERKIGKCIGGDSRYRQVVEEAIKEESLRMRG